ncbi:hypothetical protein DN069_34380 [Streptacidiphilus pinicola]|uniref:Uncharacterized protein n=1 Tax=Streptacidiphilus pinicola TaxID=2219663 RepID=A0A2X0I8D2_9ACTN|nr:hypothetical protein DN069_34380 [Streptacidiphilus pinicola]
MTFGTLLSSQGTDASFGPVSPGPPGASFVFYSIRTFCLRFSLRPVPTSETLADFSGRNQIHQPFPLFPLKLGSTNTISADQFRGGWLPGHPHRERGNPENTTHPRRGCQPSARISSRTCWAVATITGLLCR